MSNLEPILWCVLHIILMADINTSALYLIPGKEYRSVVTYHIQGILVRTIQH